MHELGVGLQVFWGLQLMSKCFRGAEKSLNLYISAEVIWLSLSISVSSWLNPIRARCFRWAVFEGFDTTILEIPKFCAFNWETLRVIFFVFSFLICARSTQLFESCSFAQCQAIALSVSSVLMEQINGEQESVIVFFVIVINN